VNWALVPLLNILAGLYSIWFRVRPVDDSVNEEVSMPREMKAGGVNEKCIMGSIGRRNRCWWVLVFHLSTWAEYGQAIEPNQHRTNVRSGGE